MLFKQVIAAATVISGATLLSAAPSPLTPATSNVGATCLISWGADTSGTSAWKETTITLMTGANQAMVEVLEVGVFDTTSTTVTSYSWVCPEVTPTSAIYFYQFALANGTDPTWTTRFAIASASGEITTPTNATQPDGSAVPWGTGVLVTDLSNSTASAAPSAAASSAAVSEASSSAAAMSTSSEASSMPAMSSMSSAASSARSSASSAAASTTPTGAGARLPIAKAGTAIALVAAGMVLLA